MEYERRFGGIARLYGQAGLECFSNSNVAVIGVGGVGSWAVEALARSGIGSLTLYDLDHIAESNINRQLPALESELGKSKVLALSERIKQINPLCKVIPVETYIDSENDDPITALILYGKEGENVEEPLLEVDATDKDCTDGKEYYINMKFKNRGNYMYHFEFENKMNPRNSTMPNDFTVREVSGFFHGWSTIFIAFVCLLIAVLYIVLRKVFKSR